MSATCRIPKSDITAKSKQKMPTERVGSSYITQKQNHCTPTCAIPSNPAAHSNALTVLQQATSARDAGWTRMFAKADVLEVVPSRTKYGEIPSDVPRDMIL